MTRRTNYLALLAALTLLAAGLALFNERQLPAQDPPPAPPLPAVADAVPQQAAAVLHGEAEIPEQVEPYQNVVFTVRTNAKFTRVKARRSLFDVVAVLRLHHLAADEQRYAFTGPPGVYLVEIDYYDPELGIGGEVAKVTIGQPAPDPDPPPGPDPDPDPEPDPPANDFERQVRAALEAVPAADRTRNVQVRMPDGNLVNQPAAQAVGGIYARLASEATDNPQAWDAAALLNEAKTRLATSLPTQSLLAWRPFFPLLAEALQALRLPASDLEGHVRAFRSIAQVLSQ